MKTTSSYLRWLSTQVSPDIAGLGPPLASHQTYVIGQATGYTVSQIAPFVRSLRAHFEGAVILVVDDDPAVLAFMEQNGVQAVSVEPDNEWSPHVVVSRIAVFDRLLANVPATASALLTDVRDVVFQGDPLSERPTTVEAFDEQDSGCTFADHSLNRKYVTALVGSDLCETLNMRSGLCVGTVAGPVGLLRNLCRIILMLCAIPRSELGGAFGADQAAFNLAIHLGLIDASVEKNFSRVATVGVIDAAKLPVVNGQITNPDGSVSPVVHQYDRHPHLIRHINETWDVTTILRPRRHDRRFRSQVRKLEESIKKRVPTAR